MTRDCSLAWKMPQNPLQLFCRLKPCALFGPTLIVVAHPDDEVVGAGAQLPKLQEPYILHVTDGAPANMADARSHGFKKRKDYAGARRRELVAAMEIAGIPSHRLIRAGKRDQEASFDLFGLTRMLAGLIEEIRPSLILCHAYEGGHPDHDAAAFATRAAVRLLRREKAQEPVLLEFALYHATPGGMAVFEFLHREKTPSILLQLSEEERSLKQRMLDCFQTQKEVLSSFPVSVELFRIALACDFTAPPHRGRLYYENFGWGMDGKTWRTLAAKALRELKLASTI